MKSKLRKEILAKRDKLGSVAIVEASEIIEERLFTIPEFKDAKTVCFFVSFRSEVNTHEMIKEALLLGKQVCVPVVKGKKLVLSSISSFSDLDRENIYGILEPSLVKSVDKNSVDITVVPGAVFDHERHRIGYGGGYYDELLSDYDGLSIGVCFDIQIVKAVPRDSWDEQVSMVVSEKRVI